MIYLTAIGLSPGGSSTVHIYTQTIQRTTLSTQTIHRTKQFTNQEVCGPCPIFERYALAFALQLRKKHRKISVRVAGECQYRCSHLVPTVSHIAAVFKFQIAMIFFPTRQIHFNLSENNFHNMIATIFRPELTDIYFVKTYFWIDSCIFFSLNPCIFFQYIPVQILSQLEPMGYPLAAPKAFVFHF